MSANEKSSQKSLSLADRLQQQLAKIKAAERKKFLNENIVRLEKNGDLSCETVRTYSVPVGQASGLPDDRNTEGASDSELNARTDLAQIPAISNSLPIKLPQTPALPENGNLIADPAQGVAVFCEAKHGAQPEMPPSLTPNDALTVADQTSSPNAGISCHEGQQTGNQQPVGRAVPADQAADPLEELLHRALVATKTRRGRPPALDDQSKGQLIALLSVGMSMRQAAAVLGVSHTTVQKTLKADPALAEEITAARFQAQLQPLACVIREARRSWKAATWLLKYLDSKIASHEETPDERRQRQQRETEEFLTQSHRHGVKTRRVLG